MTENLPVNHPAKEVNQFIDDQGQPTNLGMFMEFVRSSEKYQINTEFVQIYTSAVCLAVTNQYRIPRPKFKISDDDYNIACLNPVYRVAAQQKLPSMFPVLRWRDHKSFDHLEEEALTKCISATFRCKESLSARLQEEVESITQLSGAEAANSSWTLQNVRDAVSTLKSALDIYYLAIIGSMFVRRENSNAKPVPELVADDVVIEFGFELIGA